MMKILTFLFTFGINLGIAFCLLFFMLLGLNGYSEKDANWGIFLYLALGILSAVLTGVVSVFAANYLVDKKQFAAWSASLTAIIAFVVIGSVLNFVCFALGIIMAEIKRTNF